MKACIAALCLVLASGCTLTPTEAQEPVTPAGGWELGIAGGGSVLYGRDGMPVGSNPTTITTSDQPLNHSPDSAAGSRPFMLELYQEAVNDREFLEMELALFEKEREDFLAKVDEQAQRIAALEQENVELSAEREALKAESFDLGDRLATAQLRRLESEKALLERNLKDAQAKAQEGSE